MLKVVSYKMKLKLLLAPQCFSSFLLVMGKICACLLASKALGAGGAAGCFWLGTPAETSAPYADGVGVWQLIGCPSP